MAALSTIALVGVAVAGVGVYQSYQAGKDAEAAQQQAAFENRKTRAEQSAINQQQAMQERRQQIREERVRRAQIMNQSALGGVSGSSGEMGATSALSTGFGANIGFNQSMQAHGQAIGGFQQRAADFQSQAQSSMNSASMWGNIGSLGMNVFQSAGGFNTMFGSPTPKTP